MKFVIIIVALLLLGFGVYTYTNNTEEDSVMQTDNMPEEGATPDVNMDDESTSASDEEVGDGTLPMDEDMDAAVESETEAEVDTEATTDAAVESETEAAVDTDATTDATVESETEATTEHTFNITGNNYEFSQEEIRVNVGDTVTINFTSTGGLHDWVVNEFGAATTQVGAGESDSITFVADQAGEFEYYCSVGSHRQLGMVGTLIVE